MIAEKRSDREAVSLMFVEDALIVRSSGPMVGLDRGMCVRPDAGLLDEHGDGCSRRSSNAIRAVYVGEDDETIECSDEAG